MVDRSSKPASGNGHASHRSPHIEALRLFVLSTSFQCGVQLMVGMIVICLFIFVRDMTFPQACLSATLYVVCTLLVSQDTNVGTKVIGCSMVVGALAFGVVYAGILVSIAKQVPGWQPQLVVLLRGKKLPPTSNADGHFKEYTAVLCCLAVFGLGTLSIHRMGQYPPFLWALGMISCLSFGIVFVLTQFLPDVHSVWRMVVAYLLADVAIAASTALLMAVLVLPRLAVHELQSCLATTASGVGAAVSRYASRLTVQDPSLRLLSLPLRRTTSQHVAIKVNAGSATEDDVEVFDNELDDQAFVELLQKWTTPSGAPGAPDPSAHGGGIRDVRPHVGPPAMLLWPNLSRAKMCIPSAMAEPAVMTGAPFNPAAWGRVIGSLEELVTRAAALELLLEEKDQVLDSAAMVQYFGADKVPVFRLALGQVAAGAAHIGLMLHPHRKCKIRVVGKEAWSSTKEELRTGITMLYRKYWSKLINSADKQRVRLPDAMRVRAIFFAWVLTNGLVEAMENLEEAVVAATSPSPGPQTLLTKVKGHLSFGHAPMQIILGLPMWGNWFRFLRFDLPTFLTSKGFRSTMKSRTFQAGVKYWLALSTVLLLILGLSAREDVKEVRQYRPLFGYIAAALSMSEKVEATMSKVAMWIFGSTVGGVLGWLAMMNSSLATNPYGLTVIICVFTLLTGFGAALQFRTTVVLTLMTLLGMVLCQYKGCCNATGSTDFFVARLLAVIMGCSIPVVLSNLILPWFNSQWALEVLGKTFQESVRVAEDAYAICYFEGHQAAKATSARHDTQQAVATSGSQRVAGGNQSAPGPTAEGVQGDQQQPPPQRQLHTHADSPVTNATSAPEGTTPGAASPAPLGGPAAASIYGTSSVTSAGQAPQPGRPSVELTPNQAAMQASMKAPLRNRVALPLVGVQVGLIKDGVTWNRGLLSTPPMVAKVMFPMFGLLDRLTALQLSLSKPTLTGEFSGWAFNRILSPVHDDFKDVLETMHAMADATATLLVCERSERGAQSKVLAQAIEKLEGSRLVIRNHVIEGRRRFVKDVVGRLVEPSALRDYVEHPDDYVRLLGFLFAFVKTVDRATTVARVALNCSANRQEDDLAWVK